MLGALLKRTLLLANQIKVGIFTYNYLFERHRLMVGKYILALLLATAAFAQTELPLQQTLQVVLQDNATATYTISIPNERAQD
jgi:hypothetical protein